MGPSGDHPRVCGEKQKNCPLVSVIWGSPPRMRGKAARVSWTEPHPGITPAYAGKSCQKQLRVVYYRDHPRVCGEKLTCFAHRSTLPGSPPRMRGKGEGFELDEQGRRITPAYAGKRFVRVDFSMDREDHPRVCGEKPTPSWTASRSWGSPPRMRGKD